MTRMAILCPGPSLGLYANVLRHYDERIGVNQAVEAFSCDWWVFKDHNIFAAFGENQKYGVPHPPRPTGILTLGPIRAAFNDMDPNTHELTQMISDPKMVEWANTCRLRDLSDWEFNRFEGFGTRSKDMWKRFSVGSALMLAYQLGASEIDCFGCDMKGGDDYRGRPGRRDTDRDEARWKLEHEMFDLITGWLGDRKITVTRILAE